MLNFHNVYDFFNDSQKSIQKRRESAQLSASLSPLAYSSSIFNL